MNKDTKENAIAEENMKESSITKVDAMPGVIEV